MRRLRTIPTAAAACVVLLAGSHSASTSDPFAFFSPSVQLTSSERSSLAAGSPVVKLLPHGDYEMAVFGAVRTDISGERLVEWTRVVDELKRSSAVHAIARFSTPPQLEDLAGLSLDAEDLNDLRRCRPGRCDVKLSAAEIREMQDVIAKAGSEWERAAEDAFRRFLLARATSYETGGLNSAPPYNDRRSPTPLASEFQAIMLNSPYLAAVPEVVTHFEDYPREASGVESFLYWSKEHLGGKPVVALTHVAIARPVGDGLPEVLVASRQFYASHYMTGALALTAIIGGKGEQPRYLAYLNRSKVDVLDGLFGGIVRRVMEGRLRNEAAEVLNGVRRRLESGAAPHSAAN